MTPDSQSSLDAEAYAERERERAWAEAGEEQEDYEQDDEEIVSAAAVDVEGTASLRRARESKKERSRRRKMNLPSDSSKPVLKKDRAYGMVGCIACVSSVGACLASLTIFFGPFQPAWKEHMSLVPATCVVDRMSIAKPNPPFESGPDEEPDSTCCPTDSLVDCYMSCDEGQKCGEAQRGYGVCVHIAVNFTLKKNLWSKEPCLAPMYYKSDAKDQSAGQRANIPKAIYDIIPTSTSANATMDDMPEWKRDYLRSVRSTRLMADSNDAGADPHRYPAYKACAVVDCRENENDAINATKDLLRVFPSGVEFDCFYDDGSSWLGSWLKGLFGKVSADLSNPDYHPVILRREYDYDTAMSQMIITSSSMAAVCFCYYFLLCREWWCQYRWAQRLQRF